MSRGSVEALKDSRSHHHTLVTYTVIRCFRTPEAKSTKDQKVQKPVSHLQDRVTLGEGHLFFCDVGLIVHKDLREACAAFKEETSRNVQAFKKKI